MTEKNHNPQQNIDPDDLTNKDLRGVKAERTGVLSWFAENKVAANLVMLLVIVSGLISLAQIKVEVFPELDINVVTITVPFPGASPDDVESGILKPIEEAVREVDGVEEVNAIASEGSGMVFAELDRNIDYRRAKSDIENAVDRITTFPEEAEDPIIAMATNRTQVVSMSVYGDVPLASLKEIAEQIRDDLTTGVAERRVEETRSRLDQFWHAIRPSGGITTVTIGGLPDYEISIEVAEETLRRYNLKFADLSRAIRESSLDVPAGSVESEGGEILVRLSSQLYRGPEFENIVVRSQPDGTVIRLRDIAEVKDSFADEDLFSFYDGQPAVNVNVFRVSDQGALEVASVVKTYLQLLRPELPEGVDVQIWSDRTTFLKDRISLLLRNAGFGLILVFLCLSLFLDLRLAFWTTMGIPMSFLGAFFLIPQLDVTVNMISLFAFIVVLGIVVDDAIIVGENVFDRRHKGMKPLDAAIAGVKEMAIPVVVAITTTIAAFSPLMLGEGVWDQILRVIPIVVICVLLVSLIECLIVLPAHLSEGKVGGKHFIARLQGVIRQGLQWFIDRVYQPVLEFCLAWRYATLAAAVAVLLTTLGLVGGGHIRQVFFPQVEADQMIVALTMPQGTPVAKTVSIMKQIEEHALEVRDTYEDRLPEGAGSLFQHRVMTIGGHPVTAEVSGRGGGADRESSGAHLGELNIELLDAESRGRISAAEMIQSLREKVGEVPSATELTFAAEFFASDPVSVELAHRNYETLVQASNVLKEQLREFDGISDISDSFVQGKRQYEVVGLTPLGESLGVTLRELGMQLRAAFYGDEAQRIQRGRDEVKAMVRYPADQRVTLGDIESLRYRMPDGTEIPFLSIAEVALGRGYASIHRTDGRRTVSVTADVNTQVVTSDEINQKLQADVLPRLIGKYPGLSWNMQGEQEERDESMAGLRRNFVIALIAIYALLAMQFRSYVQPLIVMIAIPFGMVGAVMGHLIMGLPLSFMTFFGLVALTGVVVNDSLILIDLINRQRKAKMELFEVVRFAGARRFRPILLTTLTTFFGLMPMITETSLQAQFLIPMAVSLGVGVLFATPVTLLLVPSVYLIIEDVRYYVLGSAPTASNEDEEAAENEPSTPRPAVAG